MTSHYPGDFPVQSKLVLKLIIFIQNPDFCKICDFLQLENFVLVSQAVSVSVFIGIAASYVVIP